MNKITSAFLTKIEKEEFYGDEAHTTGQAAVGFMGYDDKIVHR